MQTAFLHVTQQHESDSVELLEFIGTFRCTQSCLERKKRWWWGGGTQCRTKKTLAGSWMELEQQIRGLLKTDCNVIASFRAGKKRKGGILVHEWCCLNEHERWIVLQCCFSAACWDFWALVGGGSQIFVLNIRATCLLSCLCFIFLINWLLVCVYITSDALVVGSNILLSLFEPKKLRLIFLLSQKKWEQGFGLKNV